MIALTHQPSPNMQACERTFVPHLPIDFALAVKQHAAYCQALADCGAQVRVLDVNLTLPDCTFIEDTAVVLDEVAILCSMGTPSRQPEPAGIELVLNEYRPIERILSPATLEGGDVLRIGRRLLVESLAAPVPPGLPPCRERLRSSATSSRRFPFTAVCI